MLKKEEDPGRHSDRECLTAAPAVMDPYSKNSSAFRNIWFALLPTELVSQIFFVVLCFPACPENTDNCSYQYHRRQSDKQPFKCMENDSGDCGFRVIIIPA